MRGMEGMPCGKCLRTFVLCSLERRRVRGDLIALCSFLRRRGEEGDADLLSRYPMMRHTGMVQSCAMGGLGSISLPRERSNTATVSWRDD